MIKTGFPALDNLTGGFAERKGYLLYGDAREAATALALSFLSNGDAAGRPVALVTERNPNILVEEAARYGFNLSPQLENGSLLLFEYPANISAKARKLEDDSRIIREFQNLVGNHGIDRLVFDPVTPLLLASDAQAVANRFQRISSSFSGLGATTIYVLQGPGAADYVPACRDSAEGVLRLVNSGSGTGKIVIEGWPTGAPVSELEFGVVAGVGLVPVSRDMGTQPFVARGIERPFPASRPERRAAFSFPQLTHAGSIGLHAENDKPRILLMHPDTAQRSALVAMLQKQYAVEEAHGAIDGMASLSDRLPDVLVLAPELRGISGAAIVHKIRQAGHNLPVIVVGSRIRRLADQIALLRAGADACLEAPINEQLLNLHVGNLLCRVGRLKEPYNRQVENRKSQLHVLNCTTDLEAFCHRAAEEVSRSAELGLPVPVLVMHSHGSKALLEELSSAMLLVTRSTDLVYVGLQGIAVLLPEARAVEPVLARFYKTWTAGAAPVVDQPRVAGQLNIFEYLCEFIAERTGAGFPGAPVSERDRSKSIGVTGNGAKL